MRKTGFLLYNKVMVLSDFHCHLYGYDSGESMKALLNGFSGECKENRRAETGRKESLSVISAGDELKIRPGMIFTNIRERDLWESGALFSLDEGVRRDGKTGAVVVPFIGIHPWDFNEADDESLAALEQTAVKTGAFIGEIGLDRLHLGGEEREKQRYVFKRALEAALKVEKPFTIHCVREWGALISVLESVKERIRAPFLVHAYSGSAETMEKIISLGGYISFGTLFSHGREGSFSEKAADCILKIDRRFLLLETDWTWHAGDAEAAEPDIYRGALLSVYEKTAELLKIDITELCGVIEENGEVFKAYTANWRG